VQGDSLFHEDASTDSRETSVDEPTASLLAHLKDGRGKQLGISLLHPDFFGQVLQFVAEVRLAATQIEGKKPRLSYTGRVAKWWELFEAMKYRDDDLRRSITKGLQALVGELHPLVPEADHLKIEVWIRSEFTSQCDPRELELWCSSQSIWLSDGTHWSHRLRIGISSTAPAVMTFANRGATDGKVDARPHGRWSHFVAVPVVLEDDPHLSIPVGVVVMLIHAPEYRSDTPLPSYQSNRTKLLAHLVRHGVELLIPTSAGQTTL